MSFRIGKSYFKIGNGNKEKRKEFKSCRVKIVVWLTKIELKEELAKGITSHDRVFLSFKSTRKRKVCQRSADLKDDGPVKGSTLERECRR